MSLFGNIFGNKASAPAPAPTNNPAKNPGPPAPSTGEGTAANGVIPPGATTNEPGDTPSPLEKYKDLWQPSETAPGSGEQSQEIDPQKLMEAAGKVDFSKIADQASLEKIAGGGQEAVGALVQLLNKTAQQVYGQSTVTTAKIVEMAVGKAREDFTSQIPELLRKQGSRNKIFEDNPAFSNPAIAPLIEAQVSQLANKYPKATPAELNSMAKEYLVGMATLLNPPKAAASSGTGEKGEDWSSYI